MRDYCREWNSETYEWESISDTKKVAILRRKFREDKKFFTDYMRDIEKSQIR